MLGLLMYFDRSPTIVNLEIFGIGQPITQIPEEVKEKAKEHPTYIVVNEHRLGLEIDSCCELVESYPRPLDGPALLLLKYRGEQ